MPTIPDAWYEEKVREEIATQEQSNAMKSFLAGNISADEAAKILTKDANQAALEDTTSSEKLIDELCNLWGFLIDFILEWPILETVDILHAISQLPHVDRTGKDALGAFCDDNGVVGEPKLWEDLPKFWNSLSDTWDSEAAWRAERVKSNPETRDSPSWTNINFFAAFAFRMEGRYELMPLLGYWGCHVIKEAAAAKAETFEADLLAAEAWIDIAPDELYDHYYRDFEGQFSDKEWHSWAAFFMKTSREGKLSGRASRAAANVATGMWGVFDRIAGCTFNTDGFL